MTTGTDIGERSEMRLREILLLRPQADLFQNY